MVVASITLYHVSQKLLGRGTSPYGILATAYLVAFLVTFAAWGFSRGQGTGLAELRAFVPMAALLGIACVGIELGYLLAYQNGWQMSTMVTPVTAVSCFTCLLIGLFFFREPFSLQLLTGAAIAIAGVVVMQMR